MQSSKMVNWYNTPGKPKGTTTSSGPARLPPSGPARPPASAPASSYGPTRPPPSSRPARPPASGPATSYGPTRPPPCSRPARPPPSAPARPPLSGPASSSGPARSPPPGTGSYSGPAKFFPLFPPSKGLPTRLCSKFRKCLYKYLKMERKEVKAQSKKEGKIKQN